MAGVCLLVHSGLKSPHTTKVVGDLGHWVIEFMYPPGFDQALLGVRTNRRFRT